MPAKPKPPPCADVTKKGTPCQRRARSEPDADGRHRCWDHSTAPEVAEARELRRARIQKASHGLNERRQVAEAALRAGLLERPARRGKRGPEPLPDVSRLAKIADALPEVLTPETLAEYIGHFDTTNARGRSELRTKLVELHLEGRLSDRSLDALTNTLKAEAKDQPPDAGRHTLQVRFELITSRTEAEQYVEAQDFREGSVQ